MAQNRMNIRVVEDNFPELQRVVEDLGKYRVEIGIFGEDDGVGESYVMIANVHEFGVVISKASGNIVIPERSFMRSTFDEREKDWAKFMEGRLRKVLNLEMTVEQMYEQVGAKAASDIQKTIRTLSDPPNAESTIEKKGSSNPLIDTGDMRRRVTWKVVRVNAV